MCVRVLQVLVAFEMLPLNQAAWDDPSRAPAGSLGEASVRAPPGKLLRGRTVAALPNELPDPIKAPCVIKDVDFSQRQGGSDLPEGAPALKHSREPLPLSIEPEAHDTILRTYTGATTRARSSLAAGPLPAASCAPRARTRDHHR